MTPVAVHRSHVYDMNGWGYGGGGVGVRTYIENMDSSIFTM